MKHTPMSLSSSDLQYEIGFTDDDLKANQQGILSDAQRDKLADRQQRSQRLLSGIGLVVAVLTLGAVLLGNFGIIVLGIMAMILAVMGTVEYVIGYHTYNQDLASNHVETIQGVVRYIWRGESAMGIASSPSGIRVGDIQFLLIEEQARSFSEGDIYTLYYAPATHTLLSAEKVRLISNTQAIDADVAYWEESITQQKSDAS